PEAATHHKKVMKESTIELNRLKAIHSASPEYDVILTYLLILNELIWTIQTDDKLDLEEARRILDRDHHDLEKVKRRIIEYLAVLKLKQRSRAAKERRTNGKTSQAAAAAPAPALQAARGEPGTAAPPTPTPAAAQPAATVVPGDIGEDNVSGA